MRRWFWLAVLIALVPTFTNATGSLSIPNVIANLAGSPATNPAALLDANWNAARDYVNAREVTIGTLGARPLAGTAGRWYVANDTDGGTPYVDNGSSWAQVAAGVTGTQSIYMVRGLIGATVTATNTQYNFSANRVTLWNPSTGSTTTRAATATLTNDMLVTGPAANGRDASAAFAVNTWIHLYFIWNGSALATLSSLCAPSDVNSLCSPNYGPTLPTGYTHWAYAGALRVGSTGLIVNAAFAGPETCYYARQTLINTGTATAETTVSVASQVAPNATAFKMRVDLNNTSGGALSMTTRHHSTFDYIPLTAGATSESSSMIIVPNVGQQFFYQWSGAPGGGVTYQTMCFTNPNGDS